MTVSELPKHILGDSGGESDLKIKGTMWETSFWRKKR